MCTPLAIAGIALTAASTVANTVSNNQVQKARNDALAAERIRQQGFDQQAQALNVQSQDRYQDFGGQQDERSRKLADYFQNETVAKNDANQQAAAEQEQAALPTSSGITLVEDKKQSDNARAFTDAQGAALGNLRSFGDLMGDIGRSQARDASLIGQIGGFKKGSASITPYELDAAGHAGDAAGSLGDILGAGGSALMSHGLQGGWTSDPKINRDAKSDKLRLGGTLSGSAATSPYQIYRPAAKDQSRFGVGG